MVKSEGIKSSPVKRLINKIKAQCVRWQKVFYLPKQLLPEDTLEEFADAKAEYIVNYTNNVIKLSLNGENYFFKEARERCGLRQYIDESVKRFFSEVCTDCQLEAEIVESLNCKSNFKKLINMGNKAEACAPLNEYLILNDERSLGLPSVAKEKKDVARKFIFYIYGEINNYFCNYGVKKGARQTFLATRAVAVKKFAELLNAGHLIPETRYVKIIINGQERFGVLQNEAQGADLSTVPCEERQKRITPMLLRELTVLNVLDVLCYDNDHRVNNYHTVIDKEDKYIGVTSFDNDGPNVFLPSSRIKFKHSTGCAPLIKRGLVNRPHMDRQLAEALLTLKRKSLEALCDLLNSLQISCLWKRIKKLRKAILKTVKINSDFLTDKDGWTAEHIKEDLSGKYKKTYLVSFLADCYYPDGMHPFDAC